MFPDAPAIGSVAIMPSSGDSHVALLSGDGTALAVGDNGHRQCDIPPPPPGKTYVQLAAGGTFTILLCSDGQLVITPYVGEPRGPMEFVRGSGAIGMFCRHWGNWGQHCLPLPPGMTYKQVAAGHAHWVCLRSDGVAVAGRRGFAEAHFCKNFGQTELPPWSSIVQIAAGHWHSLLLDTKGAVHSFGRNEHGQCDFPRASPNRRWTRVRASNSSTALIREDGQVYLCGMICTGTKIKGPGFVTIPPQLVGKIVDVAIGFAHVLVLSSDGQVAGLGENCFEQCQVPWTPVGVSYTEIDAYGFHSVLLRSDGLVVFRGETQLFQRDLLAVTCSRHYVEAKQCRDYVVQLHVSLLDFSHVGVVRPCAIVRDLRGELLATWCVTCFESRVQQDIEARLAPTGHRIRIVTTAMGLLSLEAAWWHLLLD